MMDDGPNTSSNSKFAEGIVEATSKRDRQNCEENTVAPAIPAVPALDRQRSSLSARTSPLLLAENKRDSPTKSSSSPSLTKRLLTSMVLQDSSLLDESMSSSVDDVLIVTQGSAFHSSNKSKDACPTLSQQEVEQHECSPQVPPSNSTFSAGGGGGGRGDSSSDSSVAALSATASFPSMHSPRADNHDDDCDGDSSTPLLLRHTDRSTCNSPVDELQLPDTKSIAAPMDDDKDDIANSSSISSSSSSGSSSNNDKGVPSSFAAGATTSAKVTATQSISPSAAQQYTAGAVRDASSSSLQWHEASVTSSRVLVPPSPSSSGAADAQQMSSPLASSSSASFPCPPPSMRKTNLACSDEDKEVVAVFNANTKEGKSMVRALAKSSYSSSGGDTASSFSSLQVVAIVRVFTSKTTKSLLELKKQYDNIIVKVADSHDREALGGAVKGAHRAFFVTRYWDRFDSALEEKQALIVLEACASSGVSHLVLSSFEDARILRERNLKSQIVPLDASGTMEAPTFDGMRTLKRAAKDRNVLLTHMITSYLDQEHSKMSLCLIVGENGNLIINSHTPQEV